MKAELTQKEKDDILEEVFGKGIESDEEIQDYLSSFDEDKRSLVEVYILSVFES